MNKKINDSENINPLSTKVSALIRSAQGFVTQTINKGMVMLYWQIGKTIQEEVIKNDRAEYGKRIVQTLSEELVFSYGKGYSRSNLTRMMEFYKCFPDVEISATLSHQFPVRSVSSTDRQYLPIETHCLSAL